MKRRCLSWTIALGAICLFAAYYPHCAFATETSGGSMPWDSPLENVLESIRGPVAYAVSIIGLVTAGATLIWGGEISEFTRRIVYLVLVISLIALSSQSYTAIFSGGATFS